MFCFATCCLCIARSANVGNQRSRRNPASRDIANSTKNAKHHFANGFEKALRNTALEAADDCLACRRFRSSHSLEAQGASSSFLPRAARLQLKKQEGVLEISLKVVVCWRFDWVSQTRRRLDAPRPPFLSLFRWRFKTALSVSRWKHLLSPWSAACLMGCANSRRQNAAAFPRALCPSLPRNSALGLVVCAGCTYT